MIYDLLDVVDLIYWSIIDRIKRKLIQSWLDLLQDSFLLWSIRCSGPDILVYNRQDKKKTDTVMVRLVTRSFLINNPST